MTENGKTRNDFQTAYAREVAERLISQLELGVSPCGQAWESPGASSPSRLPWNPATGVRYQGINSLRLLMENRPDARWMTLRQINELGGRVKKGEKGVRCIYFAQKDVSKADWLASRGKTEEARQTDRAERVRVLVPCPFTVFNAEQTSGLSLKLLERRCDKAAWEPEKRAEALLRASGAAIRNEPGNSAWYSREKDVIVLPERSQFREAAAYYDTALHELAHWTGHESRLARLTEKTGVFGSEEYAREELRAETASLMVSMEIGIPHRLDAHAAYIGSWIRVLRDDPRELLRACSDAQRITDYVLQFDLEKAWVVNYDRGTAFRTDADAAVRACEQAINGASLLTERFIRAVQATERDHSIVRRDAEWRVAKNALSPEANGPALARAGMRGIGITKSPSEFLLLARAAGPALEARAYRSLERALGARGAEAAKEASLTPENRTKEMRFAGILERHFRAAEPNAPDAKSRYLRASPGEQRRILEKAGSAAAKRLERGTEREAERPAPERDRGRGPELER